MTVVSSALDADARPITPIQVDGNTTLGVKGVEFPLLSKSWQGLFRSLDRERSEGEEAKDARTMRSHHVWLAGKPVAAEAWKQRQVYHLEIEGVAHFVYNRSSGSFKIQLGAASLWAEGYLALSTRLITQCHAELFHGQPWRTKELDESDVMATSRRAGWTATNVELCLDMLGIRWLREDGGNFTGRNGASVIEGDEDGVQTYGRSGDFVETVEVGRRRSPASICLYNKSVQLRKCAGGDTSIYAATWREGGWKDEDGVSRAELRLRDEGLHIEDTESEERVDLRDPASLADPHYLSAAWGYHLNKKRLIVREATRIERCPIDPRWKNIQEWGVEAIDKRDWTTWRQRREVQKDAAMTALNRAKTTFVRTGMRLHGMLEDSSMAQQNGTFYDKKTGEVLSDFDVRYRVSREIVAMGLMMAEDLGVGAAKELAEMRINYVARKEAWLAPEMEMMRNGSRTVHVPEVEPENVPIFSQGFWDEWNRQSNESSA